MSKKLDPTRPVRIRDGRPARVICTDRKDEGAFPIVALVLNVSGLETVWSFRTDGTSFDPMCVLENIPVVRPGWVNVYPLGSWFRFGDVFASKEAADKGADKTRIACIHVQFEEGDGL